MTNDQILQVFRRIEAEVAVERWTIDGIHVWPLFRAQVFIDNFWAYKRAAGRGEATRRQGRLGQVEGLARNAIGRARAAREDRGANAELRPVDALLYSDGVSFLKLDGKYFDRFCDPIREGLEARHRTSLMITPLGFYQRPRHSSSVFIQPRLDLAQLRGAVAGRLRRGGANLEDWDRAIEIARAQEPAIALRPAVHLARSAAYIAAYEAVHRRILDRTRPRVVFVISYYGAEVMALIRACRERNITTVDVQHGALNGAHWAYVGWSRVPARGFELLPKYFWVWSASEADTIRAWSERTDGAHVPVIGGNRFLTMWRDGVGPVVESVDARFREIAERDARGLTHVVYTTNGFETEVQLRMLREAISRTSDRIYWWIRMHPTAPESRPMLERGLAASTGKYRVDPGELPLYGLFRNVAVHVTEASSAVIEATMLGVPTILLSKGEALAYQELIDSGWATVLGDSEDLASAVVGRIGAKGVPAPRTPGPDPLDVILQDAGSPSFRVDRRYP